MRGSFSPMRFSPTTRGGYSRASNSRDRQRRIEDRGVRARKPLPCWEKRIQYVLVLAAKQGRLGLPIPHQWTARDGSPRCVRCRWEANQSVETLGFPLPVCDSAACLEAITEEVRDAR